MSEPKTVPKTASSRIVFPNPFDSKIEIIFSIKSPLDTTLSLSAANKIVASSALSPAIPPSINIAFIKSSFVITWLKSTPNKREVIAEFPSKISFKLLIISPIFSTTFLSLLRINLILSPAPPEALSKSAFSNSSFVDKLSRFIPSFKSRYSLIPSLSYVPSELTSFTSSSALPQYVALLCNPLL
ncbi:hypothetical protein OMAG_001740 [Candidatus Omnitrophus magneticus]|uniref:Uncharacterized protein n=1 Tax=Candidatus Omnitrophus magneticus TaxID=1609969 RepID=A0A0F0CM15_9BACT|nr:hypothetical protein OMAG_001740 [Candidatus Omnitrophus magneticus]